MTSSNRVAPQLQIEDWGLIDYRAAFDRQAEMVAAHLRGERGDTLVLAEHPATVTLGRRGSAADLRRGATALDDQGVMLQQVNRGGLATAHEPGQLVVYPVLALPVHDLRQFSRQFLDCVVALLADYGVTGELKSGAPGVWVNGAKICSFGIALKKWVSSHGIALNLNNSLRTFDLIIPCGVPTERLTSLAGELGKPVDLDLVKQQFVAHFCAAFGYQPVY